MLVLVVATSRRFPDELLDRPVRTDQPVPLQVAGRRHAWRTLLANRMVALILGYQLLSAAVTLLLDYMVWERAAARYPDPISLAQFHGLFGAVMNVVSVLFVVTLGGWLLTRFGIGFGLAANPLGVLVLLVRDDGGRLRGRAGLVRCSSFWCVPSGHRHLAHRWHDPHVDQRDLPGLQPRPLRAQTMVEGAGVPLALGFVGVLLIAARRAGLDITAVVVVTLLLTAVWLVAAVLAFREYGVNLRGVLSRRAWEPVALRIDDASRSRVNQSSISSADPRRIPRSMPSSTPGPTSRLTSPN